MQRFGTTRKTAVTGSAICIVALLWALGFPVCARGSDAKMRGPHAGSKPLPTTQESGTSCVEIAFLQSIRFYQKWISPIGGGDRCGLRPSCSAYGYEAVKEEGPVIGLMMTADRLTRCNIWKRAGAEYTLLPNGKLYDPISKNLLFEK